MRSLPGDGLVADARIRWNHAITIRAHPADIWPWLVQMGCRRAGWYSYDSLDNGGVPSAERIVPELQRVQVGDIFPMTPTAQDRFVVRVVEPDRALVLGDDAGQMSWAFALEPVDATSTRLITRSRGTIDRLALGLMLKVFCGPASSKPSRSHTHITRPSTTWCCARSQAGPARWLGAAASSTARWC